MAADAPLTGSPISLCFTRANKMLGRRTQDSPHGLRTSQSLWGSTGEPVMYSQSCAAAHAASLDGNVTSTSLDPSMQQWTLNRFVGCLICLRRHPPRPRLFFVNPVRAISGIAAPDGNATPSSAALLPAGTLLPVPTGTCTCTCMSMSRCRTAVRFCPQGACPQARAVTGGMWKMVHTVHL